MRAFLLSRPALSGLVLCGLALALAACDDGDQQQAAAPPPPPVTVIALQPRPVSITTTLPGRVTAYRTAEIRPQVGGLLRERLFREGETVAAGQTLFQIDPAPYEAALASAQANQARAEATLANARLVANRYRPLVAQNAVSRLDYENAVAAQKQAEADVAAGRAAVRTAQIDLDHTRLVSPIAGRTGRPAVTEGALVTAQQADRLLTVTQLDPVYVDVTQSTATLLRLRREMAAGRLRAGGDSAAEVRLLLEDGTAYPLPGTLQFSEVTADPETGSVTLRAVFPNPDGALLPGMFVRQQLEEGISDGAILAPQQGVSRNPKGEATALVVQQDGTVQSRILQTGQVIAGAWLVTGGLQAGDRLVVEGMQRIAPGMKPEVHEVGAEEFQQRIREAAGS